MAKIEVREGDTLTIKVRVSRVSDDGEKLTIEVAGQRYSGTESGWTSSRGRTGQHSSLRL